MERIPIRDLNQQTSAIVARAQRGETLAITSNGRVVAQLVPVEPVTLFLDVLVSEGRAASPTVTGPIPLPVPVGDPTVDVAAELAAARDEERW
ncbi:type II toxin-antitoxin system Phd/YefM family antitoxin [Kutzneria sp. NPDC052558]|uniref:type II toxin-antitoxin system Phd/YefM family antitoxin n=1 Tax=Kutzneria sp. NPDC052558 TaxID=3364121 RepID=UPI0037C55FF3